LVTVDCVIEDPRWAELELATLAQRAVEAALARAAGDGDWEVAVLGCDDARIASLNGDFRDRAAATNVLSWPSDERGAERDGGIPERPDADDPELGDIAIAYETCCREAQSAGIEPRAHVTHLLVHGCLHLLGYDHIREADGDLMEALEIEILAGLGIDDPYGDPI